MDRHDSSSPSHLQNLSSATRGHGVLQPQAAPAKQSAVSHRPPAQCCDSIHECSHEGSEYLCLQQ